MEEKNEVLTLKGIKTTFVKIYIRFRYYTVYNNND